MKCWSYVHNIAVLCINALFPPFPMPSSNLIGFGTRHSEGTILCELFIYLLWKLYLKYSDRKEKTIHWLTLNSHWAWWKAILYFTPALDTTLQQRLCIFGLYGAIEMLLLLLLLLLLLTVESLVTDVRYAVLIRFPIIAQPSKGVQYFYIIELLV